MAFTREGLNYSAMSTLFVLSTELQREEWCAKVYGDSFNTEDTFNIYNTAKKILNLKRNELMSCHKSMKSLKHYTQCFSIAISLVEEYITILNESYDNICGFH